MLLSQCHAQLELSADLANVKRGMTLNHAREPKCPFIAEPPLTVRTAAAERRRWSNPRISWKSCESIDINQGQSVSNAS